jgi:hypothetical protein
LDRSRWGPITQTVAAVDYAAERRKLLVSLFEQV